MRAASSMYTKNWVNSTSLSDQKIQIGALQKCITWLLISGICIFSDFLLLYLNKFMRYWYVLHQQVANQTLDEPGH